MHDACSNKDRNIGFAEHLATKLKNLVNGKYFVWGEALSTRDLFIRLGYGTSRSDPRITNGVGTSVGQK